MNLSPAAAIAVLLTGCASIAAAPCGKDYAAIKAAEISTIEAGETVLKKVIVDGVPQDQLTAADLAAAEAMETVLASRSRAVDEADIGIIDRAASLLARAEDGDRADDRDCGPDDQTFSLFCALKRASEEVIGAYEHRRTALQEVRFAVEDARPGVEYEHRLQGFNNDPSTSFEELKSILAAVRARIGDRLALQAACKL